MYYKRVRVPLCMLFVFIVIYMVLSSVNNKSHYEYVEFRLTYQDGFPPLKPVSYLGNLPEIYLEPPSVKRTNHQNEKCNVSLPEFTDIHFTNDIWQTQRTTNGTFYLFNAFYDRRVTPYTVRIVAMLDRPQLEIKQHSCHLWYSDGSDAQKAIVVPVVNVSYIWRSNWGDSTTPDILQPYLITCAVPWNEGNAIRVPPVIVSLVEEPCSKATNSLRVWYEESKNGVRDDFVVCVKGLNYPHTDLSGRLSEWIELLHLLGASKVVFYEFNVHPNIRRLLEYYTERHMVDVHPITLVGGSSNLPLLQSMFLRQQILLRQLQEGIPYNDCLYHHLYTHKYVVLLDIDEVIVPLKGTWPDLIRNLEAEHKHEEISAYVARNAYFLKQFNTNPYKDIPGYMHMLQNVNRSSYYTSPDWFVKCFHDTDRVLALHNHLPLHCLNGACKSSEISTSLAHLQHYRSDCAKQLGRCGLIKSDSVTDDRLWAFKDDLIERVQDALKKSNILDDKE